MQEQRKNKIHYSIESRRDLDGVWDYIVSELQNPSAAENVVGRIMDDIDRLAYHGLIGTPLSSVADVDGDYRFLVSGNYMAFYRANGNNIYIDRILYGRRDYLRVLLPDSPGTTD